MSDSTVHEAAQAASGEDGRVSLPLRVGRQGQLHWLVDATLGDGRADWFDPAWWPEANAATAGRGNAWFVRHNDDRWVLRRYLRGGHAARLSRDRYLFAGLSRTRSFREWRLLRELYSAGLPVPRPVAASVFVRGLTYRATLITVAIEDATTLATHLEAGSLTAERATRVGRCVRRFNDAGVWHADLNANNVLLTPTDQVYLIDFDRGRHRGGDGWQAGTVARLKRSLDKISTRSHERAFDPDLWRAVLDGYGQRQ